MPAAWVTGDEIYGNDGGLRRWLEAQERPCVPTVARSHPVWHEGAQVRAEALLATIPAAGWRRIDVGAGGKGPRIYDRAGARLPSPTEDGWAPRLLIRRSVSHPEDPAFSRAYGREDTTLEELARVAGTRWAIEEGFAAAKGAVGLDWYEVRRWEGWHRQVTLCLLAHSFLAVTRATAPAERGGGDGRGPIPVTAPEGRRLLAVVLLAFAPTGPLVFGVDETLERRRGKKIAPKGIYRDAVRSSHGHFVKASGLRWVCLMLLVPIPWAGRVWALPVLTALAPSERYDRERGRRHKALTDWARQLLLAVRRWWPDRPLVAVADSSDAALAFPASCRALPRAVTVVTRLRLDAALYEPAPPRRPGQTGRPRLKGKRLPTVAAVAADPATEWTPVVVARWYGRAERAVEVATATAVWSHTGPPVVPLRWVPIRDPRGRVAT